MKTFKYFASLRKELLKVITGVENSGYSLFWDESTPNWITKNRLETIFDKYLLLSQKYGLYIVTRHCNCHNPKHGYDGDEYPITNRYGLNIKYHDEKFHWRGGQTYQGDRKCICPCSQKILLQSIM